MGKLFLKANRMLTQHHTNMDLFIVVVLLIMFFTAIIPADLHAEVKHARVIKKQADIRELPDAQSRSVMVAFQGLTFQVIEELDEWLRVVVPVKKDSGRVTGYILRSEVEIIKKKPATPETMATKEKKDKIFLMGMGMLRLNFTKVEGNDIRFRYSDLGLPTDFSTRERASFMVDGTFGHGEYTINGHVNYDPENRITEPPLEFLVNAGNEKLYLSAGDYHMGVMLDSVFSRYYHPFRGGILGVRTKYVGLEILGGLARGESGIDEIPADAGSGPYYLADSPILRGSEVVYLVTRSASNPDLELTRTPLVRNQDYFIDYDRGSLIFTYSLYPYDELGNPVFIMVNYQFESLVGRFSRAVFGFRAFVAPLKPIRLSLSYIADAEKDQSLGDILKNSRGIYSFGLNVDTKPLTFFGEFAFSSEETVEKQDGIFGGGIVTISRNLRVFFNGWVLDTEFPTFANNQLQYGYSLFQIFPSYAQRNIYLSPFQFTRNLGAELYPFSLARLSIDEKEVHGFAEWESKAVKLSTGYGVREESMTGLKTDTIYLSGFFNTERTKVWGKVGNNRTNDPDKTTLDAGTTDLLLGVRQGVFKFSHGDIFVQADYQQGWYEDFLDISADTRHQAFSILAEYLTGQEGLFVGYRKETLTEEESELEVMDADIFEVGIRRHIYKGFFLDCRYRREESTREGMETSSDIIGLGAGFESTKFRAMGRYEIQTNDTGDSQGKRRLWSLFLFGNPFKRMSISLRYYKQLGRDDMPLSLNERSEEQLAMRFLWRPWNFLNLYSQWRYDTNLELYPPLDRTKSNSLAQVHGLKLTLSKRFEFLANYKLLKVWGPIDNRKYAAAAEIGYLLFRHFRLGAGVEFIDYRDEANLEAEYRSTVGYLKLVVLY